MKKKISYILLICLTIIPLNYVYASGFSTNETISACGFDKYIPAKLPNFTSSLFNILKIVVPIVIIVMGMIDFAGAMMANDEKKMKEKQKKFITRLIAGVLVFMVMAAVQFIFKQVNTTTSYKNGFVNCADCLLNGNINSCKSSTNATIDTRKQCSDYGYQSCKETDDFGNQCRTGKDSDGALTCLIKGNACEDYSASECPSKVNGGVKSCMVVNGKCSESVKCSDLSVSDCATKLNGTCKWNGNSCVKK